jgi:probable rRNA maturation factor
MAVHFISEYPGWRLKDPAKIKRWITRIVKDHKSKVGEISYTFVTDERLFEMNKRYLNHSSYTDIITFEYSTDKEILSEIFISIDRVKENADGFGSELNDELHRVMIHGILHLLGFGDKTPAQEKRIRKEENNALAILKRMRA